MRTMLVLLALVTGLVAQVSRLPASVDNRFLEKTKEPDLKSLANGSSTPETYRLILHEALRIDTPTVVRIEMNSDGSSSVHTKWLAERKRLKQTIRTASVAETKKLLDLLNQADFWNQQQGKLVPVPDGYSVILEGVREGRYHAIEKWSAPNSDSTTKIAKLMLKIGRSGNIPRGW